jgi:hypothetical protein
MFFFLFQYQAASPGQMYTATQDQLHELKQMTEQVAAIQQQQKQTQLNPFYESSGNTFGSEQLPQFAPLIGHPNRNDYQFQDHHNYLDQNQQQQQHQYLTETEVANLLNYGTMNINARLPAANLVLPPDDISQRQKENEKILEQARLDLMAQQNEYTTVKSAYEQHQKALADQLNAASEQQQPFQIFVPDEDYQSEKVRNTLRIRQKRYANDFFLIRISDTT